jgi:hypothetical protein
MKFILYFSKFYFAFYGFLKFILIFGIINKNKKIEKHGRTVLGRTVVHGLGLLAQPSRGYGPRHSNGAHAERARGAVTTHGARVVVRCPTARW